MQIQSLILATLTGASLTVAVSYAARTRVHLRIVTLPLRAATVTLVFGIAALLAWSKMEGTDIGTWFSNRSTAVQLASEIFPVIVLTIVVVWRRPLRLYPVVAILTLVLCLGSLWVTNRALLLGVVSDAISGGQRPLPHGWGVHTPPARRFVGYAVAVALATWATLALTRRKETVNGASSLRDRGRPKGPTRTTW